MIGKEIQQQLTALSPSQEKDTISPSDFLEIELDEDEVKEALRKGRETKYFAIKREDYRQKISQATTLQRPSARELYEYLKLTQTKDGLPFQVVDWNRESIFKLCLYFAGDPKCETKYGMSLGKGILLMGQQGTGKTHLMNFFQTNPHVSYRNVHCKLVAERYAQKWTHNEIECLQYYSADLEAPTGQARWQDRLGYCFGDLGTEAVRKQYGNETNVMEHIITQRYDGGLTLNMTHFTCNLNADEIEQYYGVRVRDRLAEMCNKVVLDGPSWRK